MRKGKRGILYIYIIVTLLVGITISSPILARNLINQKAPPFTLSTVEGKEFRFPGEKRPALISFWTTWCAPCREELPELNRLRDRYGDRLQLLAINVKESPKRVQRFLDKVNLNYPVLLDKEGVVARAYKMRGLPYIFIIDADGIVREDILGSLPIPQLQKMLEDHFPSLRGKKK